MQGVKKLVFFTLISKQPRHILGANCEKLLLFRIVRKNDLKINKNSTIQICTRLLRKCVEIFSKTLTIQIERLEEFV